jgi:DNA-binding response OmpR family regulator
MSSARGLILVVEDAEDLREFLEVLFERAGFSVLACEDAERAFALARQERPDLIVTDLMLGASSGLDLITRLRSDLAPPVPPIVVCSGFSDFEARAMERGAAAFIPKPFEPSLLLEVATGLLARREMAEHQREEAAARARDLRARVVDAARVAMRRLDAREAEMTARAYSSLEFLPRYFGFGQAFFALMKDDGLRIRRASDERVWVPDAPLELALCRDMLETSSAVLVPDLLSLGANVRRADGERLRFFAGVPLSSGATAVGVLCFTDREPRRFGADGYALLEAFGRRGTALLSGRESESSPLLNLSGYLSREGLGQVLAAELSRMELEPLALGLLLYEGAAPDEPTRLRTAWAQLDERRFALLLVRESDRAVEEALHAFLERLRARELAGAGVVDVERGAASPFDGNSLIHGAERLLDEALRAPPGTLQRIRIRREDHATPPNQRS